MTCSERVIVENVRVSARRPPRGPGVRTQTVSVALPMSSPATRSYRTSISDPLLAIDDLQGVARRDLNAWTQTRALTAAIRGTRGPRAKHLSGLSRTSDRRRRRTTAPFSSPEAAIKIARNTPPASRPLVPS
jgi:hypothetical protein